MLARLALKEYVHALVMQCTNKTPVGTLESGALLVLKVPLTMSEYGLIMLQKFLPINSTWDTGTIGQYLATLIMLYGAENNQDICTFFSVGPYTLPESPITQLTLAPKRSIFCAENFQLKDYNIIFKLAADQMFVPSSRFGPDGVMPLMDSGALEGFLVFHCNQHEAPLSWQKFAMEALANTNPLLYYRGAPNKFQKWVTQFNNNDGESLMWLRVSCSIIISML